MRLRTRVLALFMSVLMVLSSPMQALAEGEDANRGGDYLGEVYVAVAKTPDEAARSLAEKGYTVLKADDGKPADLNQGAGSALKEDAAVVLGYKTTADRAKAVTDLAVMNMNGGYSFSDYDEILRTYRDSQIRPFIDRFMTTVQEYRANAASDYPSNRAKADFAKSLLNRIREDDTGGFMGDLLLDQTLAELGTNYSTITDEQKEAHIDLETSLMQGSAEVVYLTEQVLASAADANPTTWLERLSVLGPNGLEASYGDMRPTDVQQDMATKYQDAAIQLSQGWEDMRAALLKHASELGDEQQQSTESRGDGGSSATEEPIQVVDENTTTTSINDPVQQGEDEVDVSEIVRMDVDAPANDEGERLRAADAPQVISQASESMNAMSESVSQENDARIAAIYAFLKAMPYGDGTLYDFFTKPSADVTGENISVLYPAVSCLSPGQLAAMEFLPLERLLQIGATVGTAFSEVWEGDAGLKNIPEFVGEVSLYQGVNRDIFTKKTALTSEALRTQALQRADTGVTDILSPFKVSTFLWASTAVSALLLGASAYGFAKYGAPKLAMADTIQGYVTKLQDTFDKLKNNYADTALYMNLSSNMSVKKVSDGAYRQALEVTIWGSVDGELPREKVQKLNELEYRFWNKHDLTADESIQLSILQSTKPPKNQVSESVKLPLESGLSTDMESFDDAVHELQEQQKGYKRAGSKWNMASKAFTVATVLLTVASIVSTVYELMAYYNVKYPPIPGYIVDERDVTTIMADGTKVFERNDTAYYKAVETNAVRDGDHAILASYADLNGDKGKEWLALYALRDAGEPILASSLRVVTGVSSLPEGYAEGIHMFGSDTAFNLTDPRYCYNDDANGVYAYFKREVAAPAAASAFSGGSTALVAGAGLLVGAALGAGGMYLAGKRRREPTAA